jgi:hypothetical protein
MNSQNNPFTNKLLFCSIALCLLLLAFSMRVFADTQYLTTAQFLKENLFVDQPKPNTLWLVKERAKQAEQILGHSLSERRQRYWKQGNKTAWILEEIGKSEPITAGFVVESGKIAQVRVLTYRESRGGEVRPPAFVKQYLGAVLQDDYFLDRNIDGISGATLSVHSMNRMARLALYYDALSRED